MALTPSDHKRIHLKVADEIKRMLSNHNGSRVMAKHKARLGGKDEPLPAEDESTDAETMEEMSMEPEEESAPEPKKKKGKGMPAMKGGMGGMHH